MSQTPTRQGQRATGEVSDRHAPPEGRSPAVVDGSYVPQLDKAAYQRTGRCTRCRSYVDDIGPGGTCWPCDALACGDLIVCACCTWWIRSQDAGKACEACGWPPQYERWVAECISHGTHLRRPGTDGPCAVCGSSLPTPAVHP